MAFMTIDVEKCNHDGLCALACPLGLIEISSPNGAPPKPIPEAETFCITCGHCVSVCPQGALSLNAMKTEDCPTPSEEWRISPESAAQFMKTRRSIRNYKKEPVPREQLEQLIAIASWAPSGHNSQPVQWLVLENPRTVQTLAGLVIDWMKTVIKDNPAQAERLHMDRVVDAWNKGQDRILRGAPHLIVAHAPGAELFAPPAAIIALTYVELAAHAFGLGACWAGYLNAAATVYEPLFEALKLPQGHKSLGALMIGRPRFGYERIPLRKTPKVIWRSE